MPSNEVYSSIYTVHESHRPSFLKGSLSGDLWRHDSIYKTIVKVTNADEYQYLQKTAISNMKRWKELNSATTSAFVPRVEVKYQDWGDATLKATKDNAVTYTLLNPSNKRYPGGAALEGGSALEENIWHRSTCILSLVDKIVTLDKETNLFVYTEEGTALVEARKKMTAKERDILKERCPIIYPEEIYKTLHDTEPRICFRGPEIMLPSTMEDFGASGHVVSPDLSYALLPADSIFPFYELRSAAPEHFAESQSTDPQVLKEHREDLRRRIAAQLDTLILAGQSHAVLGAWGCGAFKNEPELVAEIYAEEIEKRAVFFQHLLFPILNTESNSNNYDVFEKTLNDMPLGDAKSHTPSP
ncbi:poly(ADP-ribose) glycohydrolase domain-containing protein [Legionella qingyii]|nr:poly(ADP-ribose) glycohydrolase domain-containing protein [Legionella qingyii]